MIIEEFHYNKDGVVLEYPRFEYLSVDTIYVFKDYLGFLVAGIVDGVSNHFYTIIFVNNKVQFIDQAIRLYKDGDTPLATLSDVVYTIDLIINTNNGKGTINSNILAINLHNKELKRKYDQMVSVSDLTVLPKKTAGEIEFVTLFMLAICKLDSGAYVVGVIHDKDLATWYKLEVRNTDNPFVTEEILGDRSSGNITKWRGGYDIVDHTLYVDIDGDTFLNDLKNLLDGKRVR